MSKFEKALQVYNDGDPLSDGELGVLVDHFRRLELCVRENKELSAIRYYAFMNLNRLEEYVSARKEKNGRL